jgi:hypothetical protein
MNVSTLGALAAALTAIGVSIAACGGSTTNNNAISHSSHTGESCLTTADCMNSDVCVNNVCASGPSSGDGGTASSSGGTTSSSGGTASSSGGTTSSSGGSSSGSTTPEAAPPHLGSLGDQCLSTSDCASGLSCIPNGFGGGICDLTNYGLSSTVTGKSCGGECNSASDCCELPVDKYTVGTTLIHHCSDLDAIINGGTCPSTGDTTTLGQACFLKQTYCGSCGSSWTCTANRCLFTAQCTQGNPSGNPGTGGCATWSRLSHGLVTVCNTTSMKCAGTTSTTGCSTDSDCTGTSYINFTGAAAGTCKAPNGNPDCSCQGNLCYLACAKDLDCAIGYSCDTTTRTCKPVGNCTSNSQCITASANVLATCTSGNCVIPCSSDHDCSQYSGSTQGGGSFGGQVCVIASGKTTGTCKSISGNCSADTDCNLATGTAVAHTFCVSTSATSAATYYSAITN